MERENEARRRYLIRTRQGSAVGEKHRDYWSEDEVRVLKEMFTNGIEIGKIAYTLGRGERSVIKKINDLSLFEPVYHKHERSEEDCRCLCGSCGKRNRCQYRQGNSRNGNK